MFEKEAEEYAENREVCGLLDAISENLQNYDYGTVAHYNIDPLVEECFKDGAEFAYNKANEWHYVKDGDLPKDEDWKWCVSYRGYFYVAKYEEMFGCWTNQEYSEVMQPYAWKEIVLPKEEME